MTRAEVIIKNAFRVPSIARDYECMIAEEMWKHRGPSAGATPRQPNRLVGFAVRSIPAAKAAVERRREEVLKSVGDKPIGRTEVFRMLPHYSEAALRNDLLMLAAAGKIKRVGNSIATKYVRQSEIAA